ncbi:MAG TPA: protein kinase [Bryobacteraceae bacterium]|nr:protein kinase [Bryobacteraceae bacterium]
MDDPTLSMRADNPPDGGRRLLAFWGPFKILQKVGEGAFGEVYRAFDPTLEREVALKLLLARGPDENAEYKALLREARALARVRHNNVVSVYGAARYDGRLGFWSDFVRGNTLSTLLTSQGPFGPRETVEIGIDVCRALSAVHAAGLLHRDIKAGNVMREEGGRILLMDFGLTHDREEDRGFAGTPAYMAPELFGQPASAATDIYAVGVLLFHLLTNSYPVDGSSVRAIREAHATGARRTLFDLRPDVPTPVARVVETAAHPDPSKRYATAGQMIAALTDSIGLKSEAVATKKQFRPWMLAPIGALALLLAIPQVRRAILPATPSVPAVPQTREIYYNAHDLLQHYYKPKALETAIPLLEKVTVQDPQYPPAWADLGLANLRQFMQLRDTHYIEPARKAINRALTLNPELAAAHVTLGMLYTETAQNDLASQELSDALKLDNLNAEAYSALGELYYRQGRTKDAESAYRKSVELDPRNWRLANEFGIYYYGMSRFDQAAEQLGNAVALAPDNPRTVSNLGILYWQLGRLAEAQAKLEDAIRLDPSSLYYTNLGRVLNAQAKYPSAKKAFEQAIQLNPSSYLAWGGLAKASAMLGEDRAAVRADYGKAITFAEDLRKERKNDAFVLADLGTYYASVGDDKNANPLLRQAAALAPENAEVLGSTAVGFELLHDRNEALHWLKQALAHGLSRSIVENNPDLSALRADARYGALINLTDQNTHGMEKQ